MAYAVSWLGKTFDHFASALAGEASWSFVFEPAWEHFMEALLVSTGVVALAEIGDKTQIATVAIAAHCANPVLVVISTTLGMLLAGVPAGAALQSSAGVMPQRIGGRVSTQIRR